jgi:hypothetical protein
LIGVGEVLLGAGWAVVDACGATDVDCSFVRYHGAGGALNVSVLLFEARSCQFTVHVLTVGVAGRRGGGAGATSCGASSGSSRTFLAGCEAVGDLVHRYSLDVLLAAEPPVVLIRVVLSEIEAPIRRGPALSHMVMLTASCMAVANQALSPVFCASKCRCDNGFR